MNSLWARSATSSYGSAPLKATVTLSARYYDRHAKAIYSFCFRRVGDWAAAEDLTATVFTAAWAKRSGVRFADDRGVLPWLCGVAANMLRNHGRAHRRLVRALARVGSAPTATAGPDAGERAVDQEPADCPRSRPPPVSGGA